MACRILVPQPGTEPSSPAVEVPGALIFEVRKLKKKKKAEQIYKCEMKIH